MTEETYYTLKDGLKHVLDNTKCKFDASVEVHINLNTDVKKQDQAIRFTTVLPHGTGKSQKVAVFATKEVKEADLNLTEKDLDSIEKGKLRPKVDFDILVAEPEFMAKIAKVARILGPAGAMPNPKAGTVTKDVEKAVAQIKKGKVEIRTEPNAPIVHTLIGKKSFGEKKLAENFTSLYTAMKQNKPQKAKPDWIRSIFVTTTMGPSAELDLTSL